MANTRGVGPFFWHSMTYPVKPPVLIDPAETQEIDTPFRRGRGYALRFPLTRRALVVGRWKSIHDESEALTYAICGRAVEHEDVNWDRIRDEDFDV